MKRILDRFYVIKDDTSYFCNYDGSICTSTSIKDAAEFDSVLQIVKNIDLRKDWFVEFNVYLYEKYQNGDNELIIVDERFWKDIYNDYFHPKTIEEELSQLNTEVLNLKNTIETFGDLLTQIDKNGIVFDKKTYSNFSNN